MRNGLLPVCLVSLLLVGMQGGVLFAVERSNRVNALAGANDVAPARCASQSACLLACLQSMSTAYNYIYRTSRTHPTNHIWRMVRMMNVLGQRAHAAMSEGNLQAVWAGILPLSPVLASGASA